MSDQLQVSDETEFAITGQHWHNCPVCKAIRIDRDKDRCQNCGGEVTNCRNCGEGRRWWYWADGWPTCLGCKRNPLDHPAADLCVRDVAKLLDHLSASDRIEAKRRIAEL